MKQGTQNKKQQLHHNILKITTKRKGDKKMWYSNQLTIKMRNEEMAKEALDVLVKRLVLGFDFDKNYKFSPSLKMMEVLEIKENVVEIPAEIGCYTPDEAFTVFTELLEYLATHLKGEEFYCRCWSNDDYIDSDLEASYKTGVLAVKELFYPEGYREFLWCDDCGEDVVEFAEYNPNEKYYCPSCGEELDLEEEYKNIKPIITEKEIKIM